MTDYATWLDQTDIHHSEDKIFASIADGIKTGDRIVIYDISVKHEPFWLDILSVEKLGWVKHTHVLGVSGERVDELREALTYHVAGGSWKEGG